MAEPSKFAGALGRLRPPSEKPEKTTHEKPVQKLQPTPLPEPITKAGRGGKRSDPEYSPTTFFVRKDTKRKAARLLEDTDSEQDLSDLVEQLLAKWIAERTHA